MAETASQQIERLEAVFFKIALAEDSDIGLETTVSQHLVKILSYLSPLPDNSVRQKVLEILSHINKRLNAHTNVRLPLTDLIQLIEGSNASLLMQNFTKVYIKMGFKRITQEQAENLIVEVVTKPQNDLGLFIFMLGNCLLKVDGEFRADNIDLANQIVLDTLLAIILFPYGKSTSFPCLSQVQVKAIQDSGLIDSLEFLKTRSIQMLVSWAKTDAEKCEKIAVHYLVACCDPTGRVASFAEAQMRHVNNSIDWTGNKELFLRLIDLYMGNKVAAPADLRLRLKLLTAITRFSSKITCQVPTRCIPVVFDSLFSPNSNVKLKQLSLQFLHSWLDAWLWQQLSPLSGVISSALVQILKQEDSHAIKPSAYSAVGKLFSKFPSLIDSNLNLILSMLQQVKDENEVFGEDIETALNTISPEACQHLPVESRNRIFSEVEELCNLAISSKRCARIALRYMRLLPADHFPSRFLLFQLSAKADADFRQECLKAIFEPYLPKPDQPDSLIAGVANPLRPGVSYPKITNLLKYFHEKFNEGKSNTDYRLSYGTSILPFASLTSTYLALYLRTAIAIIEALAPSSDVLIATLQLQDLQASSPYLYRFFSKAPEQQTMLTFDLYSAVLVDILKCKAETLALFMLTELVFTVPVNLLKQRVDVLKQMLGVGQQFVSSVANSEGVELFSQLFGRIQSIVETNLVGADVEKFDRQAVGLLCNGELLLARIRDGGDIGNAPPTLTTQYFEVKLSEILNGSGVDPSDRLVSLRVVSQISLFAPLWKSEDLMKGVANSWTKAMSVKEARLRPWAIHAYGRFGCSMIGETSGDVRKKAIDRLLEIAPDEDIYSWIAKALVDLSLGPLSMSNADAWRFGESTDYDPMTADGLLRSKLVPDELDYAEMKDTFSSEVSKVVERLLNVQLRNSSKFVRECGLLCLSVLLRCAFVPMPDVVQSFFPAINQSLFLLLTEDNAHIQQTLCELMAFMYEATREEDREKQLEPLIDVLMGRKTVGVSVASGGQTEVFKEGSLGELPEGQKLSTYKELCSLASDLNQPDLIYRFMELANDRCSWVTKSVAAAGLGSIFSKKQGANKHGSGSGSKLAGSLLSGIGRLYRYQFDPDSNVRQTMASLWQLVLSQSSGNARDLISANLDAILIDIDQSLPSRLWRVRESALGALADCIRLIVDPHDQRLLNRLPSLWNAVLHLCDDIKESVRVAAAKTARSMQKVTVRVAQRQKSSKESDKNATALKCIGSVIEILFKTGVESKAEEVQAVSLATLMLLIDSAEPELLAPHSVALIGALLESSSSLEPQVLSYISVRAQDESELAALESVRVRVAGMSPTSHAVSQCIDIVPLETMPDLFIILADLLKPSAGLLTRTATCQAVTQLILRRFRAEKVSYEGSDQALNRLFNALLASSSDRSEAVRKAASSTLAQLACLKPESFVKKMAQKACDWYLKGSLQLDEDTDAGLAKASSSLFQSLVRHCPIDLLQNEASQSTIVPCLFFALHEKQITVDEATSKLKRITTQTSDVWDDVWSEVSQGTESTLRRYLSDVCELLSTCSQAQKYALKLQTAVAIESLVVKVDKDLTTEHLTSLTRNISSLLQGRTWPGKEIILEVSIRFIDKVGDRLSDEAFGLLFGALVKEARKSQLDHAVIGYKAVCKLTDGKFAEQFSDDFLKTFEDFLTRCSVSICQDVDSNEDAPAATVWPKKLAVVAEFLEISNSSKVLSERFLTRLTVEPLSNSVELFTASMLRTTTSNSTKQLAARLLSAFDEFFTNAFKSPQLPEAISAGEIPLDLKQAVVECVKLSSKLEHARSVALVTSLLRCLKHFYEAQSSLRKATLTESDGEISKHLGELCQYIRTKSLKKDENVAYFENAMLC